MKERIKWDIELGGGSLSSIYEPSAKEGEVLHTGL